MKVRCPDCKENFDLNVNRYDEGDNVECPECTIALVVTVKNGKLAVEPERAKAYSDTEEFEFEEE